jgi:two-component sensor histidine kinase
MKIQVLVLLLLFTTCNIFAQSEKKTKDLTELLKQTKKSRFIDIKKATLLAQQAISLAQKVGDAKSELAASQELIKCYIAQGSFDEGIALASSSIQLANKSKQQESGATLYALLAYMNRRTGNPNLSLINYTTCDSLSRIIDYKQGLADSQKGFGDLNERQGKYLEALDNYDAALKIAEDINDKDLTANILNATGIIYDYQGDYQKGLDYYLRALSLSEKIGNIVKAADYCGNIASVHFYMESDEKALEYYLKAMEMSKKTANKSGEAAAYQGMVTIYNRMNEPEKAIKYAQLDLELRQQMNDKRGLAYAYKNLGTIFQRRKDFRKAEESYLLGLKFAEETEQKIKIAVLNLQLGRLMNNSQQHQRAIPYLENVVKITKEMGVLREQSFAYEDLATAYANLGQFQKAYDFQKQYSNIKNDLITQDINAQTVRMQTIYETKNRDAKIKALEKETALKEEVIEKSNSIRNLSIASLILVALIAGLFYNRSRLKQRSNTLLTAKNIEIEEKNKLVEQSLLEKETLLREIHHRVKNNLQIISSLLNIQSDNVTDPTVLSSIKEGQSRVQAMSLIHQNLYQSEHLSNVDIENYLKELVVYLSEMFAGQNKDIEIVVDANKIEFDIDTAIPLGLIVNELVSNAYKYAFDNQQKGKVHIGIKAINDTDYELNVKDDGKGLPDDFDPTKSKSLGLKLVKILSKQLRGKFKSSSSNGAVFVVTFKDLRAYQNQ